VTQVITLGCESVGLAGADGLPNKYIPSWMLANMFTSKHLKRQKPTLIKIMQSGKEFDIILI